MFSRLHCSPRRPRGLVALRTPRPTVPTSRAAHEGILVFARTGVCRATEAMLGNEE